MSANPVAAALMTESRHGTRAHAWYAVSIFMLLYGISYIDRLILSLLAPAVSAQLHITDTQMGVLIGLGFGVLYTLTGLPLAHLIDGRRRIPLVVAGVVLWSLCTIASALAPNFTWLMIFRSGVAIGEAVLSPAAISLIADLFPRDKRTLPTAAYTGVSAVMYSGAYIAGGAALQLATVMSGRIDLEPWQLTLILVGLPGLLLAPLLWVTVPEPPRVGDVESEQFATAAEALNYLNKNRLLYGCLLLGNAMVGMINLAMASWTPTLLIRGHGMEASQAGYAFGTVGLVSSLIGVVTWPAVVKFWTNRGRKDALVLVFTMALTASWICFTIAGLTRSTTTLLIFAGFGIFFSAAMGVLVPLLIQLVTPGRMRARVMALYLTSGSLVGLTVGPPLAALFSEKFFTGPFAIGSGLALLVLIAGPIGSLTTWAMRKAYRTALVEAEAREAVD
ncbi:MAG: MFS transporter [Sphingomonadaceae bacterium]